MTFSSNSGRERASNLFQPANYEKWYLFSRMKQTTDFTDNTDVLISAQQ